MRILLLLLLLLTVVSTGQGQNAAHSDEDSLIPILSFKWSKSRHVPKKSDSAKNPPGTPVVNAPGAPIVAPDVKIWHRPENNQQPQQMIRDPKADTIEGRSAALESIVRDARTPSSKTVESFAYQAKVRNASTRVIEVVFWEYQFKELANPENIVRRQFLCGVNIKPSQEKELLGISMSSPSSVISVDSLTNKSNNLFEEKVVINRVEYADGAILQRKDWNFAEVKSSIERAIKTPWGGEMCRGL